MNNKKKGAAPYSPPDRWVRLSRVVSTDLVDAKGWYIIRFKWDTHHENSAVAYNNSFCFEDVIHRPGLIALGPWKTEDQASIAAGLYDYWGVER